MVLYENPIKLYYDIGRIVKMIFDFEPVILEQGANPLYLDAENTNANEVVSYHGHRNWKSDDDDQEDDDEIVYKKKSEKDSDYSNTIAAVASAGIALKS
jgi:hypothetical protein